MTTKLVAIVLLCLMTGTAMAQQPKVTSLMSKDLTGKSWQGSSDDHCRACARQLERHPPTQCTCVCLRAGGLRCDAAEGGQQVTLTPRQTFYEDPDDVHVVDRNASATQPAKFLVFLIKDKGAPAVVPAE